MTQLPNDSRSYTLCTMLQDRANFFMDDLNPFKDSYNFMDVPLSPHKASLMILENIKWP
jgi:hypothetical protein